MLTVESTVGAEYRRRTGYLAGTPDRTGIYLDNGTGLKTLCHFEWETWDHRPIVMTSVRDENGAVLYRRPAPALEQKKAPRMLAWSSAAE